MIVSGWQNTMEIMVSPYTMSMMTLGYLGGIMSLRRYMQNRQAYQLQNAMQLYNISQVTLNIYMIYGLIDLPYMPELPNIFGINCEYDDKIEYFVYVHYLSKYLDYFDTIFMILRKKNNQLSFLHIYHHVTIALIWGGLLYVGHGNGTAAFGCLINSVIHTIMYSHYWYTAMGYNNPFKKYITQAQMLQFVMCIAHSISVLLWEQVYPRPIAWVQFAYHIQMIMLFRNFYNKNYRRSIRVTSV